MTSEIAKAINNISKRLNEVHRTVDNLLHIYHEEDMAAINDVQDAVCDITTEVEEYMSEIEDAFCELTSEEESEGE